MARTGEVYKVGQLARELGLSDVDGSQPARWMIDGA